MTTKIKHLSKSIIEKIRNDGLSNKSKYQIAKELNVPRSTVYYGTRDLPNKQCGWPGIRGKTLDLLKEIVSKGYAVPPCSYVQQRYMVLRKYFPTICRVTIYGRPIFFLEGKEESAARAFLEKVNKKIISYQELKQVTKVFGTNLSRTEKEAFFLKKRGKKGVKNEGVQKDDSLLLDDDSFSFFYIQGYCERRLKKSRR